MKKIQFILLNVIVLSIITFNNVKAQNAVESKESARVFVQKFYDWYNRLYNRRNNSAEDSVLYKNVKLLDPILRKALIEDDQAGKKAVDIVGLDFDPFLAAQDDGFDYQTGNIKQLGNKFFVNVHVALNGKKRAEILKEPTWVIAEITKVNAQWQFVNFIYPPPGGNGGDLVNILKGCRDDRIKWAKESQKKKL